MIVLDTHVWYWWACDQHVRLDGQLAAVDGQFPAYPQLAGRLLA